MSEQETRIAVDELRRKMDSFNKKVDMRTHLLFVASHFFLHYEEIMDWYNKLEGRVTSVRVVPDSVDLCERNKEKLQSENDGTMQASNAYRTTYCIQVPIG